MKRIVGILMFLVLITGCEKYVTEISNVTLSGLYVVDWVCVVGDEGNDTISFYENGQTFTDTNLHVPFNEIKTNDFNINFESSSFSGYFEMIWLNKPSKPINWKYDTRKSKNDYVGFEIKNNFSYDYGNLYLRYEEPGDGNVITMIFEIEEDGHEHLKLLSSPYGPDFNSRQIRLHLTRIHP